MFQARTRTGFGFGRCPVRLPPPRQRPKSCARRPSAAHASLLSQPNDRHVRPAWRSFASAAAAGLCARLCPPLPSAGSILTGAPDVFSFREWSRKRYAEDPEYRQRRLAYARAYREAHKDEINERRRRKWQTDPAYRQRRLTSLHAYRDARKDEIKERQRRRYKTEPGYREKLVARAKQYQHTRDPQHRPPYDPEYQRKRRLKFVYGISPEEYDAMLARQDGVCAICRNKPDKDKPLCVDHCHVTGEVRGLLCHRCNSALGFFREDSGILSAAIAYLQAARDRQQDGTRRARAGEPCGRPTLSLPMQSRMTPA
jgi:Recombination endonuclease VII